MRWITLGMKVMMLLRRSFTRRGLNTCPRVRGSSRGSSTAGRQFDAQIGQVVRVRGHAVQESVHHRDRRVVLPVKCLSVENLRRVHVSSRELHESCLLALVGIFLSNYRSLSYHWKKEYTVYADTLEFTVPLLAQFICSYDFLDRRHSIDPLRSRYETRTRLDESDSLFAFETIPRESPRTFLPPGFTLLTVYRVCKLKSTYGSTS